MKLSWDLQGYAKCFGFYIGRRKYKDGPTVYHIQVGDHPHDPDGESEILPGPRPHIEEEAIEMCRNHRIKMLEKELEILKG